MPGRYAKGLVKQTPDPRDFKLKSILETAGIDPSDHLDPHEAFGHGMTYLDWRMNGNGPLVPGEELPKTWEAAAEGAGDCVTAAYVNEVKEALTDAGMSPAEAEYLIGSAHTAIALYRAISKLEGAAYNPVNGENDNGLEIRTRLKYAQQHGLVDKRKHVHRIGPYAQVDLLDDQGNLDLTHLLFAAKYFEGLPSGCEVLAGNEDAFTEAEESDDPSSAIWDADGSEGVGLHCIPIVGRPDADHVAALTWRRRIRLTHAYVHEKVEEAWCYLTPDRISKITGRTYEGASEDELATYLKSAVMIG